MPCIRTVSQNEDILPLIIVGERFSSSVVLVLQELWITQLVKPASLSFSPSFLRSFFLHLLILCASFLAHSKNCALSLWILCDGGHEIKVFKEALFSGFPDARSLPAALTETCKRIHSHMHLHKCSSRFLVYIDQGKTIIKKKILFLILDWVEV